MIITNKNVRIMT